VTSSPDLPPAAARVDGRSERWREHRRERREQLIDAALQAVAQYGPEASMEQIAAAAGTAKPKLYRHFADRAELVEAIGARVAETILLRLGNTFDPRASFRTGLRNGLDAYLGYVGNHPHVVRFLMNNATSADGTSNAIVDNARSIARLFVVLATSDLEAAHVPADDAEPLAHALIGAVLGATDWWLSADPERRMPRDRLVEQLTEVIVGAAEAALRQWDVALDPDAPGFFGGLTALVDRP
jgi:AcrR family transcriptional regulator